MQAPAPEWDLVVKMTRLVMFFLLCVGLWAQTPRSTVKLHSQGAVVGSVQYVVSICNTGTERLDIYASQVWAAVETGWAVTPKTNANVLKDCEAGIGMSWQRKTLAVLEVVSLTGTLLAAGDVIKINKDTPEGKALTAAIPAVGAIIRIGTTAVKREMPSCDIKEDFPRLPNYFQLAAGACIDYTLYGTPSVTR